MYINILIYFNSGIEFVNGTSVKVDEDEAVVKFCIRRTGATTNPLTVTLAYISITATGKI